MELIRGIHNIQPRHQPCVATIGNFDGVHLGHQNLLRELKVQGDALACSTTVIIFEPHPKEYFAACPKITRLTNLREKLHYMSQSEIDTVLCLPFNDALAKLPAKQFVEDILFEKLAVKQIFAGQDFRFGFRRQGDITLLRDYGEQCGFVVRDFSDITTDFGQRISSTLVREALQAGNLLLAKQYLGRDYAILGRVVVGDKRGRQIGFPTANVNLKRKTVALTGVFAVKIQGVDFADKMGIANIGTRPTVDGRRQSFEVHIFDFDGDIYGRHIKVDLLEKIRDEKRFSSIDMLRQQIQQDTERAKAFFALLK